MQHSRLSNHNVNQVSKDQHIEACRNLVTTWGSRMRAKLEDPKMLKVQLTSSQWEDTMFELHERLMSHPSKDLERIIDEIDEQLTHQTA